MFQPLLSTIFGFGIHKRNLLEARVIIASYNDHCPALSTRALRLVATTKVYSGAGAGVVMESITLKISGFELPTFQLLTNQLDIQFVIFSASPPLFSSCSTLD